MILSTILILTGPAIAAGTTEVHIVKYANDGVTILDETTKNFTWMMDNLDVYGDGVTHYYMQGPVFNDTIVDTWNPEENDPAILTKDMGAVKGTDIRDLCDLVGGMSSNDYNITLKATDGLKRNFSYSSVYNPPSRTGRMILTWYRPDLGYVNQSYIDGMRNVMLADTTTNPWGYHVLGLWDVHESFPEPFWYYYSPTQPSAQGLSVKYISDIIIYSNDEVPEPVAAFSGTPRSGTAPMTVRFTDASTNSPTSWSWNFGDGNTTNATATNPVHTYLSAGTYTVKLTATNAGGSDSETKTGYVTVTSPVIPPVAVFSGTPTSGTAPLTVKFTDASTNTPTSWSWNFGDGNATNATVQNPVHTYLSAGTYSVTLTATNSAGSDSETETDYVTVTASPSAPTITGISPTTGSEEGGTSVTIIGTGFASATAVRFGATEAASYTVNSATRITATSPAGTGTVHITVTTPYGTSATSSADQFTYTDTGVVADKIAIFRPSTKTWYLDKSGNGVYGSGDLSYNNFGIASDVQVAGDWDGGGTTEIGIFRPSTKTWYLDKSGNGVYGSGDLSYNNFGIASDVQVAGDWDGDGTTEIGIFRPSTKTWYLDKSGNGVYGSGDLSYNNFGIASDVQVAGDWDGDGTTEIGIFRPSTKTWYLDKSGNGVYGAGDLAYNNFGIASDVQVAGDWDG
ncbi:MAG TPA: PKD domain-containing protein, partial [Methanoregulaceae archaeon]|nr:PKD domain-containing protein [Methanoregulaceae archaeon]